MKTTRKASSVASDDFVSKRHFVSNGDGWRLCLHQSWSARHLVKRRRPVLIIPGYGMNSFIFSFHPRGVSLEGFLCERGFEVWRVDLRAQGDSVSTGGGDDYGMEDLVMKDLGAAIKGALTHTQTGADRADVIGCSLGGTFMYAHAVLNPAHRIGSMVAMGSPVRWVRAHPVLRLAFAWPMLVGAVRVRGTRRLAELLLPRLVKHVPWLLSVYLNPDVTDLEAAEQMVRTVEDPNRHVNREIAEWMRRRDLVIGGKNVSEGLTKLTHPLMCVLANGDGIVPRETAVYPYMRVASHDRKLLEVGDEQLRLAHADLFVANEAHARVFAPISDWLVRQSGFEFVD